MAKGMFEDHDTVRHSSEVEEVRKGRDGKHKREEFAVDVAGDWVASSEKNGALEGEVTRVVMGTFRVGMLPSFVNGGLSCKVLPSLYIDTHQLIHCPTVRTQAGAAQLVPDQQPSVQPPSARHLVWTQGRTAGV